MSQEKNIYTAMRKLINTIGKDEPWFDGVCYHEIKKTPYLVCFVNQRITAAQVKYYIPIDVDGYRVRVRYDPKNLTNMYKFK